MGKDGIVLLIAIKKRSNFRTQRDCTIQDEIDGNSLGNRDAPSVLGTLVPVSPEPFCNTFRRKADID